MIAKNLSNVQKIFGDSHSGKCQKRYRHKKEYTFFRDGERACCMTIDCKISDEELSNIAKEIHADQCFITWTAMEGYVNEEVQL